MKRKSKFQLGDKVTVKGVFFGEVSGQGEVVDARPNRGGYLAVRMANGLVYPVQPSRMTLGHEGEPGPKLERPSEG